MLNVDEQETSDLFCANTPQTDWECAIDVAVTLVKLPSTGLGRVGRGSCVGYSMFRDGTTDSEIDTGSSFNS